MSHPELHVTELTDVNYGLAEQIGQLMPRLSPHFSDRPASLSRLESIIDNPDRALFVARFTGEVLAGMATVNLVVKPSGCEARLDDFAVSSDSPYHRRSINKALWDRVLEFGRCRRADKLEFASYAHFVATQEFFELQGAQIQDAAVFSIKL